MPFDYNQAISNPLTHIGLSLMSNPNPAEGVQQGMDRGLKYKEHFDKQAAAKIVAKALADPELRNNPEKVVGALYEAGAQPEQIIDVWKIATKSLDKPASVLESEWFLKQPEDVRNAHINLKRAQQTINLGGTQAVLDPFGGGISQQYNVTPRPEDMPGFKGAQAEASAVGKAVGEVRGGEEKKEITAPILEDYFSQAEKLLPRATSGGASTIVKGVRDFAGKTSPGSASDTQLDVIAAALTSNVPRMEGPQSNYDQELYRQAAGDLGNTNLPKETRMAAIKTLRKINDKYRSGNQPTGQGQPSGLNDYKTRYNLE